MSDTPERRTAKRIAIRLPVVVRTADGTVKHGTTENVSRRGMLIVAKSEPAGTQLRIGVTGTDGTQREVAGKVVRTAEGQIAVSIDEADQAQLDAALGETQEPRTE